MSSQVLSPACFTLALLNYSRASNECHKPPCPSLSSALLFSSKCVDKAPFRGAQSVLFSTLSTVFEQNCLSRWKQKETLTSLVVKFKINVSVRSIESDNLFEVLRRGGPLEK